MNSQSNGDNLLRQRYFLWEGSWLGCLLSRIPKWAVHIDQSVGTPQLRLVRDSSTQSIPLSDIYEIKIENYLLWSKLWVGTNNARICLAGAWRWKVHTPALSLQKDIVGNLERSLFAAAIQLGKAENLVRSFVSVDRYIRYSDVVRFNKETRTIAEPVVGRLRRLLENPFSSQVPGSADIRKRLSYVSSAREPKSHAIRQRNEEFVATELASYADFFDKVEKTPLTTEQRRSAVIFEDRNLLVAAAGSGKSSTLIGKAGYAIHRNLFQPDQIVALAFNKKAAQELNERVGVRIKPWFGGKTIKAHTFHGLGYSIVRKAAKAEGRRVRVANESSEKPRLQAVLNDLLKSSDFAQDWMLFLSLCREPVLAEDAFTSLDDYNSYVDFQRKSRKNGQPAAFQALSGDVVKSAQELAIANWLFINDVPFEYEKPFEPIPETWDKYQPDFYLSDIGVWYEHFALDANGRAPKHFGDYANQAEVKRKWMTLHAKGRFFETRSHQYYDGSLFDQLKAALQQRGQRLRPKSAQEVLTRIRSLGQTDSLDLILKILHLVKSNAVSKTEFTERTKTLRSPIRAALFQEVFWPLYSAYNARLKAEGCLDYDDMIIQAAECLEQGKVSTPYKLVLVDEFQDLSIGRARLVNAMLAQHEDGVLFGVGDDWQAINGFAGSDLSFFMAFEAKFGPTQETLLTKTFRCAQGIADVSSSFIQKNKNGQKAKAIRSELDATTADVVDLVSITTDDGVAVELAKQLAALANDLLTKRLKDPHQAKYSVFLLSRYGLGKTQGINQYWLDAMNNTYKGSLSIEFSTVHKSKGLEADYVFVLGLNSGKGLTFPSTMTNDPLLDMLLLSGDRFPHAEERRLFYVALTRAKRRSTVFFRQLSPSPFVLELMDQKYSQMVSFHGAALPQACTACGKGYMVPRYGKWGGFLGCTRFPVDDCRHKIRIPR